MRLITKTVVVSILFAFQIHAAHPDLQNLLPGYVAIQEALAGDNLKEAINQAEALQKKSTNWENQELKTIKTALVGISSSKNISDARKEFKKLSLPFTEWLLKNPTTKFSAMYCPMVDAKWVQKEGETHNPYYGKTMLNCGEKISKKDGPSQKKCCSD